MNRVEGAEKVWRARYQQEPLQVIDCNMCEHISITEAEQRKRGNQYPHICQCYEKQCKHNYMERGAVFIYPCRECVIDKHENYRSRYGRDNST